MFPAAHGLLITGREVSHGAEGTHSGNVERIAHSGTSGGTDDCTGLVESQTERQIIITALDMIVEDCPLSQVAAELDRLGHTTRDGNAWTPSALFTLLPRMIQVGPKVFRSEEWETRKKRLPRVV